ncbi:MAG: ATP-binding protein [Candidatus Woesearchaeota archaeon]
MYDKIVMHFKSLSDSRVLDLEGLIFSFFNEIEKSKNKVLNSGNSTIDFLKSLYIYSSIGLKSVRGFSTLREYNFSTQLEIAYEEIVKFYYDEINKQTTYEGVKLATGKYFEMIRNYSKNRMPSELLKEYDKLIAVLSPFNFEEGFRFEEECLKKKQEEENPVDSNGDLEYKNVTFQEVEKLWNSIIGNKEVKDELQKISKLIFLYDFKEKKNACLDLNILPKSILLEGPPGTGKTSLINALIHEMKYLSNVTDKNFAYYVIDNTIKSPYYGESVQNLAKILRDGNNLNSINLIIIEDIDSIFYQRDEKIHHADSDLLNYLMNALEGIGTYYRGNTLYVSTTNLSNKIDEALLSRISQKRFQVLGPTNEEEYTQLVKKKLEIYIERNLVNLNENEYYELSKFFVKNKISAREVTNFLINVVNESLNYEFLVSEKNLKDLDYKETLNLLPKYFQPITYERMVYLRDNYFKEKMNYLKNEL